ERLAGIDPEISIMMQEAVIAAQEKFQRKTWINEAALKAGEVSICMTHIAKLTHSSSKASNIDATVFNRNSPRDSVVTFNCAKELKKDFAYSTAAYAPIAEFLQLIGNEICTNPTALEFYEKDEKQIKIWQKQFSLAFNEKIKSSHIFAKQVYFPLSTAGEYHLLTPLVSSSFAQIIYDRIQEARRKDTPENKAKAEKTFSSEVASLFPKTAVLKTTQTNHQNVSNLNGERL